MKKNFAIDLTTCSKKDRKEAIRLAKENKYKWCCNARFKDGNFNELIFYSHKNMEYDCSSKLIKISLPNDWSKFKEYIGIKEPKNGEVWTIKGKTSTWIFRFNKIDNDGEWYYSQLDTHSGKLDLSVCVDSSGCKLTKATPEEISKLEKAERENGYWWNGEELVKIPKYIHYIGRVWETGMIYNHEGAIFVHIETEYGETTIEAEYWPQFKPATKEEYEAQKITLLGQSNCSGNISSEEHDDVDDYKAKFYELKNELERLSKL